MRATRPAVSPLIQCSHLLDLSYLATSPITGLCFRRLLILELFAVPPIRLFRPTHAGRGFDMHIARNSSRTSPTPGSYEPKGARYLSYALDSRG